MERCAQARSAERRASQTRRSHESSAREDVLVVAVEVAAMAAVRAQRRGREEEADLRQAAVQVAVTAACLVRACRAGPAGRQRTRERGHLGASRLRVVERPPHEEVAV